MRCDPFFELIQVFCKRIDVSSDKDSLYFHFRRPLSEEEGSAFTNFIKGRYKTDAIKFGAAVIADKMKGYGLDYKVPVETIVSFRIFDTRLAPRRPARNREESLANLRGAEAVLQEIREDTMAVVDCAFLPKVLKHEPRKQPADVALLTF